MRLVHRLPWLPTLALIEAARWASRIFHAPAHELAVGTALLKPIVTLSILLWLHFLSELLPQWARRVLAITVSVFVAAYIVTNATVYAHFGDDITVPMVRFVLNNPLYVAAFVRGYAAFATAFAFVVLAGILLWFHYPRTSSQRLGWRTSVVVIPASFLLVGFVDRDHPSETLHASMNRSVPRMLERSDWPKYNVLLVINESWGKEGAPIYDDAPSMPNLERRIRSDQRFLAYANAFTSSSATDVSVPSLLTGVAPYESNAKLHETPFVWDWARAAGMATLLVSSQSFHFAGFDRFFTSPGPTRVITGEAIGPIVHDLGTDDLRGADAFVTAVQAIPPARPFFAIYQTNALHGPFQQTSAMLTEQPHERTKYRNALAILDAALERVFLGLQASNRLDDTVIILTGDHGEVDKPKHNRTRVESYYDEIISIPFYVRYPAGFSRLESARENQKKTIGNIDVAPTIADLVGATRDPENASIIRKLEGRSLLGPLDPDRVMIALNTNEVRTWSTEGFGIYFGTKRFVYSAPGQAQYFEVATDHDEMSDLWQDIPHEDRGAVLDIISAHPLVSKIFVEK